MGIFYTLPDDPDALELSTFIRILDSDDVIKHFQQLVFKIIVKHQYNGPPREEYFFSKKSGTLSLMG